MRRPLGTLRGFSDGSLDTSFQIHPSEFGVPTGATCAEVRRLQGRVHLYEGVPAADVNVLPRTATLVSSNVVLAELSHEG